MFSCPLCREEWCITSKLCEDCDKVRHLYSIYDKKIIMDILDKTLIVQRFKEHEDYIKDEKSGKWVKKDETDNSYEKPKTRSQK
jgi:hypothetical protein